MDIVRVIRFKRVLDREVVWWGYPSTILFVRLKQQFKNGRRRRQTTRKSPQSDVECIADIVSVEPNRGTAPSPAPNAAISPAMSTNV